MPISTKCPHCDAAETFPDSEAGNTVDCPECGGAIRLPVKARPVAAVVVAAKAKPIAAIPAIPKAKSEPEFEFDDEDEPKPRKKSKPIHESDGDEEPRPRRKSRPVVDPDDGEDDRPRRTPVKKGGGKKLLLILGGIGFILFASCAGAGVYFYLQVDKAVTEIKTQLTAPTLADVDAGTKPTKPIGTPPEPDVKANAAKVNRGDNYETVVGIKMGLGGDCRIEDLESFKKNFKDPGGADKADFDAILDRYAPWVDKGCVKIYSGAKFKYRVLVVFDNSKFNRAADAKVKGLLAIDTSSATKTVFEERIELPRDPTADADGIRLGLKPWTALKPDTGGTIPDPPKPGETIAITAEDLAAEVVQDRAAAVKKYAGSTLEVTGEVNSRSSGSLLALKGGTDENTMKAMLVQITIAAEDREAARKCQVGETVTLRASLASNIAPTSFAVPMAGGTFKK